MKLIKGESLREMQLMDDSSIDLIICDLPYGTTNCEWDIVIDINSLFAEYERILSDVGTIILFGSEPFSTLLRSEIVKDKIQVRSIYKYDWIWKKNKVSGFLDAKNRPMKNFEILSVFSKGGNHNLSKTKMTYNPQGLIKLETPKKIDGTKTKVSTYAPTPGMKSELYQEYTNYPKMVIEFDFKEERLHPTQKPTELYEYLIRTYSNPGDIILDNCAGSGTLGAAGLNIPDREYIMIELDPSYQDVIIDRLPDIEIVEGDQEVYRSVLEWNVDGVKEMLDEGKKIYEVLEYFGKNRVELNKMLKKSKTSLNRLMG